MSYTIGNKYMENDVEVRVNLRVAKGGDNRKATIGDCIDAIMDMVNGPSQYVAPAVVEAFTREHRTLQQSFVRNVIMPVLRQLAEDGEKGKNIAYDDRNEAAVKFATEAVALDPHFPIV